MTICTQDSVSYRKKLLKELTNPFALKDKPLNKWKIHSECLEKCYALSSPKFIEAAFIREDVEAVKQMLAAGMSDQVDDDTQSAFNMIFFFIMQMYYPLFSISKQPGSSLKPSVADDLTHNASLALESMWLGESLLRISFDCLLVENGDPMAGWYDCRNVDPHLAPPSNNLPFTDLFSEAIDVSVKDIRSIAEVFVFSLASFVLVPYERPYAALRHFQILGGSTALVQAHLLFNRSVSLTSINGR